MAPAIEFHDVNKWFGKLHVLRGIELAIETGEVVVVCGPSGSGKSTLIRTVNGLERVQQGEIVVLGDSITRRGVNLPALRTRVGMVFQSVTLFPHMTALQTIMLAPQKVKRLSEAEAQKVARALLERVGLREKADNYPAHLSGGQQQRGGRAREGRYLSGKPLGRPAAAGGHRPRAGHAAQVHALRRAHLGPRSRDDQR